MIILRGGRMEGSGARSGRPSGVAVFGPGERPVWQALHAVILRKEGQDAQTFYSLLMIGL